MTSKGLKTGRGILRFRPIFRPDRLPENRTVRSKTGHLATLVILCVVKWWRFVTLFESNWISWLKKMSVLSLLIEKVTSTDVRITNILQSLPHKMAENSWYEKIKSLSPYVLYPRPWRDRKFFLLFYMCQLWALHVVIQEAQLSLRDRATRACQLKSGKVLHKCRRLVFEKLWN